MTKTWDDIFIENAKLWSSKSKDSTQIGCVLVQGDTPISVGFNGIPRKVEDLPERLERPEKYKWIAHSERNAIDNAARLGHATNGSTLYVTGYPCSECAKSIVSAGIKKIVYSNKTFNGEFNFGISETMFKEAGIEVISYGD